MRQAAFAYIYVAVVITLFWPFLLFQQGGGFRLLAVWIALVGGSFRIVRSLFGGSRSARRLGLVTSIVLALISGYFVVRLAVVIGNRISEHHLTLFTVVGFSVLVIMFGGYLFAAQRLVYRPGPSP